MLVLDAAYKMRQSRCKMSTSDGIKSIGNWTTTNLMIFLITVLLVLTNNVNANDNRDGYIIDSTNNLLSLVLPHDTYPGYSIKKFNSFTKPTTNLTHDPETESHPMVDNGHLFRLMDSEFSKFFTVLEDGTVMTTSDLSPLVNRPVTLTVLEESPTATAAHHLQLFVMDHKDMLRFPGASLEITGDVYENKDAGTKIHGVPMLQANSAGGSKAITYTIIDGNSDKAFALQDSHTKEMKESITIYDKHSGVWLVTNRPLDREFKRDYVIMIQASDEEGVDKALSKIVITVLDENDNPPIFLQPEYKFSAAGTKSMDLHGNSTVTWQRFISLGRVEAKDADGDKVAYKLMTPSNVIVIVPQTGELLLANEPDKSEIMLEVEAHDLRIPSLSSDKPVKVLIEFVAPEPIPMIVQHLSHDSINQHSHRRDKRRVTRAVRPTKRIDFTEAEGDTEGKVVFQLEKETDRETFKIRDENPWVTVEPNGAVRVKKKWDFEELGQEKTIDFWVIITNAGHNGEYSFLVYFIHF